MLLSELKVLRMLIAVFLFFFLNTLYIASRVTNFIEWDRMSETNDFA